MKIENGSKLVFIGDSITDCMRVRPIGEGRSDEFYGYGYVNIVRGMMAVHAPDSMIRVVNMGIGGNTVLDLYARWQSDVLDLNPDWVSVMIGINDVWNQFDKPLQPELHVDINEYRKTLNELVENTKDKVSGMMIISPFFIEPRKNDPMRKMTDEYINAAKEIADKHSAIFVDAQAAIDKLTQSIPTASIAWDRVHPDIRGHVAIAQAFMDAIK